MSARTNENTSTRLASVGSTFRIASILGVVGMIATLAGPAAAQGDRSRTREVPDTNPFSTASGGTVVTYAAGGPTQTFEVEAGGNTDARTIRTGGSWGPDCRGWLDPSRPHFRIQYSKSASDVDTQIRLFIDVTSSADTALIVREPDGEMRCIDDARGTDPTMGWGGSADDPGEYLVWVSLYLPRGDTTSPRAAPGRVVIGAEPPSPVPTPGVRDPALEQAMLRAGRARASVAGWEETFVFAGIEAGDWGELLDPVTRAVTHRTRMGFLGATWPDGHCTVGHYMFAQPRTRRGFDENATEVRGIVGTYRVSCEQLRQYR